MLMLAAAHPSLRDDVPFQHPFRGLKPTATVVASLREGIDAAEPWPEFIARRRTDFFIVSPHPGGYSAGMANTFTSLHYHVIFSTKNREPWIRQDIEQRVWSYLGGIARENDMKALLVGGIENHVHLLLGIPAAVSVSKALQLIKGGSSGWMKESFPGMGGFAWQDGYAAFTVSKSQLAEVETYIRGQREHHRVKTFEEEYRTFLDKHEVQFKEEYVFG
jgi:REP element-mobilizing transposase RayT